MKTLDSTDLIILSRVFQQTRDAEASALLAVLAHPNTQHKVLGETYGLSAKSLTRSTAKAVEHGILHGRAGAWLITYPNVDGLILPDDGTAAGVRLNADLKALDKDTRSWGGTVFRSRLERDVALVLAASNLPFKYEIPYKDFLDTDRDWTSDFLIDFGTVRVVIECTARTDAEATIQEKRQACKAAGVRFGVIKGPNDLLGLRGSLNEARRKAETGHPTLTAAPSDHLPVAEFSATGRWIDYRGVRRPVELIPFTPVASAAPTPAPAPALPSPEELQARVLAQAEDALFDAEYEAEKAAVAAFRAEYRAGVAARKAAQTVEEQARALEAALRARDERARAAFVMVKPGHDDESDEEAEYDPELADIMRDECSENAEIEEGEV